MRWAISLIVVALGATVAWGVGNDRLLVSSYLKGNIYSYDAKTGQLLGTLSTPLFHAGELAVAPNGRRISAHAAKPTQVRLVGSGTKARPRK